MLPGHGHPQGKYSPSTHHVPDPLLETWANQGKIRTLLEVAL